MANIKEQKKRQIYKNIENSGTAYNTHSEHYKATNEPHKHIYKNLLVRYGTYVPLQWAYVFKWRNHYMEKRRKYKLFLT